MLSNTKKILAAVLVVIFPGVAFASCSAPTFGNNNQMNQMAQQMYQQCLNQEKQADEMERQNNRMRQQQWQMKQEQKRQSFDNNSQQEKYQYLNDSKY